MPHRPCLRSNRWSRRPPTRPMLFLHCSSSSRQLLAHRPHEYHHLRNTRRPCQRLHLPMLVLPHRDRKTMNRPLCQLQRLLRMSRPLTGRHYLSRQSTTTNHSTTINAFCDSRLNCSVSYRRSDWIPRPSTAVTHFDWLFYIHRNYGIGRSRGVLARSQRANHNWSGWDSMSILCSTAQQVSPKRSRLLQQDGERYLSGELWLYLSISKRERNSCVQHSYQSYASNSITDIPKHGAYSLC